MATLGSTENKDADADAGAKPGKAKASMARVKPAEGQTVVAICVGRPGLKQVEYYKYLEYGKDTLCEPEGDEFPPRNFDSDAEAFKGSAGQVRTLRFREGGENGRTAYVQCKIGSVDKESVTIRPQHICVV